MGPARLENIVIVADVAIDHIITPTSREDYDSLVKNANNYSELFRLVTERNILYTKQLGGPLPNLAQYLSTRDRSVSGYAVVGDDPQTQEYIADLNRLGVNTNRFTTNPGKTAECIYIFSSPTENYPPIWIPNASSKAPSTLPFDFFNTHDVLLVSGTKLNLARRTIQRFSRIIVYNPGPEVLSESNPNEILSLLDKVNVLSLNEEERKHICKILGLAPKDLFDQFPSLNYLLTTKGSEGASMRYRLPGSSTTCGIEQDLSKFEHRTPVEQIVDTIGAGDAFLAIAVDQILRNYKPDDILLQATLAAQNSLKHKGAYIPRLWETDATAHSGIIETD
jgi:sugar/nucleoside kinase (ribokinase family)